MAARARSAQRRPWWADRTTGDLLILGISFTVCFSVLASGALVGVLALAQPQRDTSIMVGAISDVINTLIGLLAGFLAGRTDAHMSMTRSPDGSRTWDVDRSANARSEVSDAPAGPRDV